MYMEHKTILYTAKAKVIRKRFIKCRKGYLDQSLRGFSTGAIKVLSHIYRCVLFVVEIRMWIFMTVINRFTF